LLPWHYVFKEQQIAHQTTPFTTERLRDIYTLPADAASIGKLADYFRDRVRPGDFLLAYNNLPVVYYVTRTRPALDQCWTETTAMPLWVTENSLEYMLQYRRVPRYCVRLARTGSVYSTDAREDPLNTLVERHYTKVATIPYTEFEPFCDIFELRADSPLAQYRPEGADTP